MLHFVWTRAVLRHADLANHLDRTALTLQLILAALLDLDVLLDD